MKTKLASVLILVAILSISYSKAQSLISPVNIVPTSQAGVIRVVYAAPANDYLLVSFYAGGSLVQRDRIKVPKTHKGVSRRYDVKSINKSDYTIEITTSEMTVTYDVTPVRNSAGFQARLQKVEHRKLVASH